MWTASGEALLNAWVEKGSCMVWMHTRASSRARGLDRMLTLPLIAMTSASAIVGTTMSTRLETSENLMFLMTALSFGSSVLGAASKVYRSAERAEEFRSASLAWGRYVRKNRLLMGLPSDERGEMRVVLEQARMEYDSLTETYPFVPRSVVRAFDEEHEGYTGARPDTTSGPIEVSVE